MTYDTAPFVEKLRSDLAAVLDPLVAGVSAGALLDFPSYPNVGDSLIWLGEREYLRRKGIDIVYTCDVDTYSPRALRSLLGPDDVVFLNGGGNFGDLYPRHQAFREAVLADFPSRRIIQLPQTVRFEDRESRARTRAVFAAHPGFTLLARDTASLEVADDVIGVTGLLVPDMALMLGPLHREAPEIDVYWLSRTDTESMNGGIPPVHGFTVEVGDWLPPSPGGARAAASRVARSALARSERGRELVRSVLAPRFDTFAESQLRRGSGLLSRGEVVVTDRLHGHILSLLLGIPHVVLDTRHGKLSGFVEGWTQGAPGVVSAGSPVEAGDAVRLLLAEGR